MTKLHVLRIENISYKFSSGVFGSTTGIRVRKLGKMYLFIDFLSIAGGLVVYSSLRR